eukprot:TRINITY_DN8026_c0_g1_i2.p1 TRINITY_DN8026_c0_g1~~TRINITY_DN8026_c0_g1_i2.p1  ORF type:complete len:322 (+),score=45.04 TRINITY_DN8026_c0_g1_i2:65-1030(+)
MCIRDRWYQRRVHGETYLKMIEKRTGSPKNVNRRAVATAAPASAKRAQRKRSVSGRDSYLVLETSFGGGDPSIDYNTLKPVSVPQKKDVSPFRKAGPPKLKRNISPIKTAYVPKGTPVARKEPLLNLSKTTTTTPRKHNSNVVNRTKMQPQKITPKQGETRTAAKASVMTTTIAPTVSQVKKTPTRRNLSPNLNKDKMQLMSPGPSRGAKTQRGTPRDLRLSMQPMIVYATTPRSPQAGTQRRPSSTRASRRNSVDKFVNPADRYRNLLDIASDFQEFMHKYSHGTVRHRDQPSKLDLLTRQRSATTTHEIFIHHEQDLVR